MRNLGRALLVLLLLHLGACLEIKSGEKTSGSEDGPVLPPSGPGEDPAPIPDSQVDAKAEVSVRGALAPRTYVARIFADAFTSTGITTATNASNIKSWIINQPGTFGPACALYSSYSAAGNSDCGGPTGDRISNTTAAFVAESSTVRHLNVSKTCELILADDNSIFAAAKNVSEYPSANNVNEISAAVISKLFALFFRGRDITQAELDIYMNFNNQLKATAPVTSKNDRWRAILLMMCESPEWTLL